MPSSYVISAPSDDQPLSSAYKRFLRLVRAVAALPNVNELSVSALEAQVSHLSITHRSCSELPPEINRFKNLRSLHLESSRLEKATVALCLPLVESISLHSNQLTSSSLIGACPQLRRLDLSDNPITLFTLTIPLPNLEELSLAGCGTPQQPLQLDPATLTSISSTLRSLNISDTHMSTLDVLLPLYALRQLQARSNPLNALRDLRSLASLGALEEIDVRGCPLMKSRSVVDQILYLAPSLTIVNSKRYVRSQTQGILARVGRGLTSQPSEDADVQLLMAVRDRRREQSPRALPQRPVRTPGGISWSADVRPEPQADDNEYGRQGSRSTRAVPRARTRTTLEPVQTPGLTVTQFK